MVELLGQFFYRCLLSIRFTVSSVGILALVVVSILDIFSVNVSTGLIILEEVT